jgi:Lipase (class 3)
MRTPLPARVLQSTVDPSSHVRRVAGKEGSRWSVVVTGHSLGAGIACFVGMHLRRVFFNVQVWCYSPPGWLMTRELAESTTSFVTSVVVNKDLVPRCGAAVRSGKQSACGGMRNAGRRRLLPGKPRARKNTRIRCR